MASKKSRAPSPVARAQPGRLERAAPGLVLVALAFIVYAPALGAGFIWDDGRAITDNVDLRSVAGLWNLWTGRADFDYLPLKSSFLWLVYQVFGPAPAPYHVFNVAVHALDAVLLWRVLRRLPVAGAWFAALLFLVHPVHVESVAWVSECKNTLSMMFGLLAMLAWLRYQGERRPRSYLAALALFVCGLLCKPAIVILPVVLLLCAWWQGSLARSFRALAPFFAVALLFAGIAVWFQNTRAIAAFQLPVGGLGSRLANAGKAAWWYLGKSITPVHPWVEMPGRPIEIMPEALAVLAGTRSPAPAPAWPMGQLTLWPLCAIYRQWRVTPPIWYDCLPGLAMAALFCWVASKRKGAGRGAFFALCYFLVALLPVLGLVKMSYMRAAWVADHFQYLADVGTVALAGAGAAWLWRRLSGRRLGRSLLAGAAAALVIAYAGMAFVRASDFRSEYALWSDTVAKNPHAAQAHARLGAALLARHQVDAAIPHFEAELRLNPDDADGHNNLGLALVSRGRAAEGIEQLRASLRLNDGQFFAHANLADALAAEKRYPEAAAEYRRALGFHPDLAPLHFRLAGVLVEMGQVDEAIASLVRADALAPGNPEIAAALAAARAKRGAGQPF